LWAATPSIFLNTGAFLFLGFWHRIEAHSVKIDAVWDGCGGIEDVGGANYVWISGLNADPS
jgi:hypothetical protein